MSDYELTLGLNEQSFDKTAFVKEGPQAPPEWRQPTLFESPGLRSLHRIFKSVLSEQAGFLELTWR